MTVLSPDPLPGGQRKELDPPQHGLNPPRQVAVSVPSDRVSYDCRTL
jgi:hypothetical protein